MQKRDFLKLLTLGGLAAGAGALASRTQSKDGIKKKDDSFDAILKRGTLRCGYLVYAPHFIRDPNTGKFSGIFHDLMEAAGKSLGLKIDWAVEAGAPELMAGLNAGQFDVIASGWWASGDRGRVSEFSKPVFFNALGVYVRKDETRFKTLDELNANNVRIATIDGGTAEQLSFSDFPKAQKVSLPSTSDFPFLLKMVSGGKADFTISATHEFAGYDKNNPGELKRLDADMPIRVYPNVLMVGKGNDKLQNMLNAALDELYFSGVTNRLIDQYEEFKGSFYRVQTPYAAQA